MLKWHPNRPIKVHTVTTRSGLVLPAVKYTVVNGKVGLTGIRAVVNG